MTTPPRWHLRAGSQTAPAPFSLLVTPATAGWTYAGLGVIDLAPGGRASVSTGPAEALVLPLRGGCEVSVEATTLSLHGRVGVFTGVSDFAYLPRESTTTVYSEGGGSFALPSAVCDRKLPFRYGPSADVPVELRGAGRASRQVNNFCTPDAFEADALIACEVLTPSGNWSSYPPHKHDQERPGESVLEEIYYFVVADGPTGAGIGYQRVYGHEHADIDLLAEVRDGDAILIPHGWHGPSMAVPGYDLYYLNVMAGPGPERAWRICDDPAHTWIRDSWADEPIDSRLPMTSARVDESMASAPVRAHP